MLHSVVGVVMCACVCAVHTIMEDGSSIEIIDLTHVTLWRDMKLYYDAIDKQWSLCTRCGLAGLGTVLQLEPGGGGGGGAAVIPADYLLVRLEVVDVSALTRESEAPLALPLAAAARRWAALRGAAGAGGAPTLLLFRFGWRDTPAARNRNTCVCRVPGLSYELAEWIATNLTHVVGVGTDAPTLEPRAGPEPRDAGAGDVSARLARSGVYVLENVRAREHLPERGCLAMVSPLKLWRRGAVPARLTALCPAPPSPRHAPAPRAARVVLALSDRRGRQGERGGGAARARQDNITLNEILDQHHD